MVLRNRTLQVALPALLLAACGGEFELDEVPAVDAYCLAAQRIVSRTEHPMQLVVHSDFDAFVKSKAVIEGPEIQQFNWTDSAGDVIGISCKLKSADHLNLAFGDGTAGPDGACQDMNRTVFEKVAPRAADPNPKYRQVVFDPAEAVWNEDEPGMTGPDWLKPYEATWVDDNGALHVRAKGFQVDFTDPRFAEVPERFRGIHYCHFVAPDYLKRLMLGAAEPGIVIGRAVDVSGGSAGDGG
ncbi:MAG: hypothetical protein QNJ73_06970 [Gammaproteobacteria bacterium]|nr:hypothetical protein [Gammaproteobacteria bacterium]